MITAKTLDELDTIFEKSYAKAMTVAETRGSISVFVKAIGFYEVQGTNKYYSVTCGRNKDRDLFVACQCRAGLERKACYHGAVALIKHVALKQEEKLAQEKQEQANSIYSKQPLSDTEKLDGYHI